MILDKLGRVVLLPLLMTILLVATSTGAMAQESGVIEGTVTAPEGEELPPDLEVELLFLPNGQGPPEITSQPLESDGTYRFTDLDTAPQHRYMVRVHHGGEEHRSDVLAFQSGETSKQVDLNLFARTTEADALSLPEVVYVLDVRPGGWVVAAMYRYQNSGERIIKNEMTPPVQIPLPEEAVEIRFTQEVPQEGITELPDGFAFSGPFSPGQTPLIFTYFLPYQEGEQTLSWQLGHDADRVSVLVPQLGQQTETDELTFEGVRDAVEERPFEVYEAKNLSASQRLTFRFSNLPPPPEPEQPEQPAQPGASNQQQPAHRVAPISPLEQLPWWARLVPATLAVLGVTLYLVARPAPTTAEKRAALRERRDQLIAEIATLDIRYETGSIGEQTHKRQRDTLKRELKEILRRLEQAVSQAG